MAIPAESTSGEFQIDPIPVPLDHPQLTADTTTPIYKNTTNRKLRVVSVDYVNVTGLAIDATNAFKLQIKRGSDVVAEVANTDTDDDPAGAAIPAATWIAGVLSATDANRILAPGQSLDAFFDEDGAATLPPGRFVIVLKQV